MIPTLGQLVELLKLAPRYLAAVGLFCGTLLLLPEGLSNRIGVRDFTENYRPYLGLGFVSTACLFAVHFIAEFWSARKVKALRLKNEKLSLERKMKRLEALTEEEKQILRFYVFQKTRTNSLRIDDGVVRGLVAEGIIYRAAERGHPEYGFAYNIAEVVWQHLSIHQELLDGDTNLMRTDNPNREWF